MPQFVVLLWRQPLFIVPSTFLVSPVHAFTPWRGWLVGGGGEGDGSEVAWHGYQKTKQNKKTSPPQNKQANKQKKTLVEETLVVGQESCMTRWPPHRALCVEGNVTS